MSRTALIDADILVYRCAAALRKTNYKAYTAEGELLYSGNTRAAMLDLMEGMTGVAIEMADTYDDVRDAYKAVDGYIDNICATIRTNKYLLFVTGPTNFRNDIATIAPYKGTRPDRPRNYQEVKDYVWSLPGIVVSDGCEADDVIGYYSQRDHTSVICSLDKDLDMLPGEHYNFVNRNEYYISLEEGTINFYRQILTGDKTDNIIGIRGLGPKKAEKAICRGMTEPEMLEQCLVLYEMYYEKQGHANPPAAALAHVVECGKLLWIWRVENGMWNPTTLLEKIGRAPANCTETNSEL